MSNTLKESINRLTVVFHKLYSLYVPFRGNNIIMATLSDGIFENLSKYRNLKILRCATVLSAWVIISTCT